MTILSLNELKGFEALNATDTRLQLELDYTESRINRWSGPYDSDLTAAFSVTPGKRVIYLDPPAATVTSVSYGDATIDPDEYALESGGYALRRLEALWRPGPTQTTVVYRARVDLPTYKAIQYEMIVNRLTNPGYVSETLPGVSHAWEDREREILRKLPQRVVVR